MNFDIALADNNKTLPLINRNDSLLTGLSIAFMAWYFPGRGTGYFCYLGASIKYVRTEGEGEGPRKRT